MGEVERGESRRRKGINESGGKAMRQPQDQDFFWSAVGVLRSTVSAHLEA